MQEHSVLRVLRRYEERQYCIKLLPGSLQLMAGSRNAHTEFGSLWPR